MAFAGLLWPLVTPLDAQERISDSRMRVQDVEKADAPGDAAVIKIPADKKLAEATKVTRRDYTRPDGKVVKSSTLIVVVDTSPALKEAFTADDAAAEDKQQTRLDSLKASAKSMLDALSEEYDLNLLSADGESIQHTSPVKADADQRKAALEWIGALEATGKASVSGVLSAAAKSGVDRIIVLAAGAPQRPESLEKEKDFGSWLEQQLKSKSPTGKLPRVDVVACGMSESDVTVYEKLSSASSGVFQRLGKPLAQADAKSDDAGEKKPADAGEKQPASESAG